MIKDLSKDIWNVPNALTMLRLALVPVFIVVYMTGHPYWALAVYVLASLTDALDGYLARSRNQITGFGKLMDPLADKLMVISALVCHHLNGVIPLSAIVIVAVKECIMIVGGLCLLNRGLVVYSNIVGKTATVFFVLTMVAGFFHKELAAAGYPLDTILLWCSVTLSVTALIVYVFWTVKQLDLMKGKKS